MVSSIESIVSTSAFSGTSNNVGRPILQLIREKVYEHEKTQNTLLDFHLDHTTSLKRSLGGMFVTNPQGEKRLVRIAYANPERAIAKIFETKNLILPFITFQIDDLEDDPDRRRNDFNLSIDTEWVEETQRANRIVSLTPKAVKLSYIVNIWAKYTEDMNQIIEELTLKFNPSLFFHTQHSSNTKAFMTDVIDNSTLVIEDKSDRILRKSFHMVVDTYIPSRKYRVTSTGELNLIKAELYTK